MFINWLAWALNSNNSKAIKDDIVKQGKSSSENQTPEFYNGQESII